MPAPALIFGRRCRCGPAASGIEKNFLSGVRGTTGNVAELEAGGFTQVKLGGPLEPFHFAGEESGSGSGGAGASSAAPAPGASLRVVVRYAAAAPGSAGGSAEFDSYEDWTIAHQRWIDAYRAQGYFGPNPYWLYRAIDLQLIEQGS